MITQDAFVASIPENHAWIHLLYRWPHFSRIPHPDNLSLIVYKKTLYLFLWLSFALNTTDRSAMTHTAQRSEKLHVWQRTLQIEKSGLIKTIWARKIGCFFQSGWTESPPHPALATGGCSLIQRTAQAHPASRTWSHHTSQPDHDSLCQKSLPPSLIHLLSIV